MTKTTSEVTPFFARKLTREDHSIVWHKAGTDMFPPSGPVVRMSDFQCASSYHVRVNCENAGKLYIQDYAIGVAFIGDPSEKEDLAASTLEMDTWIRAVRGEGELVVKPEQAYMISRILQAIYQSGASGEVVHLD